MKKSFKTIFSVLALLAVAAACKKETPAQETATPASGRLITIKVTAPGEINKVSLTQDPSNADGAVLLAWAANDAITVTGTAGAKEFTIKPAFVGQATAEFVGEDPGAGPYTIAYNKAGSLEQAADGSTDHLGYGVAISGADSYADVQFSSTWASQHSGSLEQSAVLRLRAKLPDTVADAVTAVHFEASESIFNGGKSLSVELKTAGDAGDDDIINVYATLDAGSSNVSIPAGTELLVQFQTSANSYDVYTAYYKYTAADAIHPGSVYPIKINRPYIESFANASNTDIGSASNPYLVGDQHQMQAMSGFLVSNQKKCFKLVDDVDMTDVAWSPLSGTSTFDKEVDFDGNGKTIDNLSSTGQYASFFGVLNGEAYDVTFDHATISSTKAKAAVVAAFLGSAAASVSASCHGITIRNSTVTNTEQYAGALSGIADMLSGPIDDCHVINTIVNGKGENNNDARVGGLLGQLKAGYVCKNSTAEGVTVTGSKNVGGLIGVAYGTVQDCWSSGSVSSPNTTSDADIALGGLVGYFENGTITDCYSSVSINQTSNGRDIGGMVGKMLAGTIEKSYATGNVSGKQRNVGGLVGLVTLTSNTANIHDCYAWGDVNANSYSSGLIGLQEKGTVIVSNCYSTSSVVGTSFALGGIVGVAGSAALTVQKCVAWNSAITPGSYGSGNWSSGAVIGVTFPTCTLTDNYRNPSMALTAYWVPASNYQHANVSASAPLTDSTGAEMADTSTSKGQAHYPQYPYHGKVETGKTLSQLASTTLGWSSDVWDFSGPLPLLK